jgi:hypothetical protein
LKKRSRALWERYFGPVPDGFSPFFVDGDRKNLVPENLALRAKKNLWTAAARGERRKHKNKAAWTNEDFAYVRQHFATTVTSEIAKALGRSTVAVRRVARDLKLRKDMHSLRDQITARHAGKLPIGTERWHENLGITFVKVADKGTMRQKWRPKHHLVWEKYHGRPVPTRNVVFKDGNRQNFDPENLIAMTREEATAYGMARLGSLPPEMKKAARLISRIKSEATSQLLGRVEQRNDPVKQSRRRRQRDANHRWTPEMIEILTRNFVSKPVSKIAAKLGVTEFAARAKAKKLGLRREAAAILAEIGAHTP